MADELTALLEGMDEVRKLQQIMNSRPMLERRNNAIVAARRAGWTLDQIGLAVGKSRERVRQIIKKVAPDAL